jgi:hypothetical protein
MKRRPGAGAVNLSHSIAFQENTGGILENACLLKQEMPF